MNELSGCVPNESAAPTTWINVSDRLGECPDMAAKICGRILALTVRECRGLTKSLSAGQFGLRIMSIHVRNPNHDRVAGRSSGCIRPGHHQIARAIIELDPMLCDAKAFGEAEHSGQPLNCLRHVAVPENGNDSAARH